jgi:carbamate kinase
MGPKVLAACEFVEKTGKRAMIGSMTDTPSLLTGETGTTVTLDVDGLELGPRETNHS